jgi:hypothetical protein
MRLAMRWPTVFCFAIGVALHAQSPMPVGLVRGRLVSRTGTNRAGELTVRGNAGLASCQFDSRTYFERDYAMVTANSLRTGDPVEVLADRKAGSANCYARTVQVIEKRAQLYVPGVRGPADKWMDPTESFAPRGDFMFGGRVAVREPGRLTLITRAGTVHVVLRPDTRFAGDGLSVEAGELPLNAHVFVRAGMNADGLLEAYQVIWGEMVAPQ